MRFLAILIALIPFVTHAEVFVLPSGMTYEASHPEWEIVSLPTPTGIIVETLQIVLPRLTLKEEITEYIYSKEKEYGIRSGHLLKVAQCESSLNTKARGKAGEIGVLQYMPKTFTWFKTEFGHADMSIYSWQDQVDLTALAWDRGLERHWSCWKSIYG